MWPFDALGTGHNPSWLVLYVLTWALHFAFVGYVLVGTAYALVQAMRKVEDPIAEQVRDRLPFMLGCGIAAGVAPLLFIQLLYQRHFYSSNLILGPRWGAVVPALIVGFYALYIAKSSLKWRRLALGVGAVCFLFVAWSWTEIHQLMLDEPVWKTMYAASDRLYGEGSVLPRLVMWLGVMTTVFAGIAAWTSPAHHATGVAVPGRNRLVVIGLAGHVVAGIGLAWVMSRSTGEVSTHGWSYLLVGAVVVELIGWIALLRAPHGSGLLLVTGGGTAALFAGAVVREAPRLSILEPATAARIEASGFPMFLATFLFGVVAIAWIVKTIRTARD